MGLCSHSLPTCFAVCHSLVPGGHKATLLPWSLCVGGAWLTHLPQQSFPAVAYTLREVCKGQELLSDCCHGLLRVTVPSLAL